MYKIEISKTAAKYVKKQSKKVVKRLITAIGKLGKAPRPDEHKILKGSDYLRIRDGDYRIVYCIEEDVLKILVVLVGDRKDVYRIFKSKLG